jgi:hypothetical protein
MDLNLGPISFAERQELHQQMIRIGKLLQESPKFRDHALDVVLDFVRSNSFAFASIPQESAEGYLSKLENQLPDTSTEDELRRQVNDLQDRLRWMALLGDSIPFPLDEEWEVPDYPCQDENTNN